MDSEPLQWVGDRVHYSLMPPDAGLHGLPFGARDQVDLDVFTKGNVWHLDGMFDQGHASVALDDSRLTQAEDVSGRSVGLGQTEGPELDRLSTDTHTKLANTRQNRVAFWLHPACARYCRYHWDVW